MIAIVTGAASGIGKAIALELARQDWSLVLTDREETGLARTAAAAPDDAITSTIVSDLRAPSASADIVSFALETYGRIDALYNVAGIALVGAAANSRASEWEAVLDVNLRAPMALTQEALPHLRARGGQLVFVASLAGLVQAPGLAAYSASKHGLIGYAEALRAEVAGDGIAVTVVCPGYVRTGLVDASTYNSASFESFLRRLPSWFGLSAGDVARRAIAAAPSGGVLPMGPERIGYWLKRASPRATHWVARMLVRRSGLLDP